MLRILLLSNLLLLSFQQVAIAQDVTGPQGERFTRRIVSKGLSDPWEITYGPDNYLWVTEAKGYKVSRINPKTGEKTVLLDLNDSKNFPRYDKIPDSVDGGKLWPQGGLMGMALHPQLLKGKPYVYLAYIHTFSGANQPGKACAPNSGGCFYTGRVVRYEYNATSQKLSNPITLTDSIPNSNDHNSGRLLIAPVNGKDFLFYTVGDMGAGQFDNAGRPNHAQQLDSYEGKVLRFHVEPDTDASAMDKWIPNDNPFNSKRQSAVWSYGHRNAQGLAYAVIGSTGRIYSSEHGPFSDDEINILEKGKNYGHPLVIGYNDGNYDGLAAGVTSRPSLPGKWHTTYPTITSEKANAAKIGKDLYRDPIKTLYPNSNAFLTGALTQIRENEKNSPEWPSEAPSSIDVYTASAIPGWQNSLLIPMLKHGKLVRLKLNPQGTGVTGDTLTYFKVSSRYRDIALSPNGTKIYLAVDSSSVSSGPSSADPSGGTSIKGCILEFTYVGKTAQPVQPVKPKKATGHNSRRKEALPKLGLLSRKEGE